MNFATIKPTDVANGPGVRTSLFVSGCTHRCLDCFNEEAWDFSYGEAFTEQVQAQIFQALNHDFIAGLSLLGGEPMEPENQQVLLPFLKQVRMRFPAKTIWCYSGYLWEQLWRKDMEPITKELIPLLDVLVDGKYVAKLRNLNLRFRGSENQRILNVQASIRTGQAVWMEGYQMDTTGRIT